MSQIEHCVKPSLYEEAYNKNEWLELGRHARRNEHIKEKSHMGIVVEN